LNARSYKLTELADILGGQLNGDGETSIRGIAGIKEAEEGDITFLANPKYEEYLQSTRASAVIAPREITCRLPMIQLENPYLAFLKVLTLFTGDLTEKFPRRVHESAIIDPSVRLGKNPSVGPFCQIEGGAAIGDNVTIVFGAYIGRDVKIGMNCFIYPSVTIREGCRIGDRVIIHSGAVIGADGFGYAKDEGKFRKIPQVGNVVLEDDVEIGANTTVDRATTGSTCIRRGSKIDNLVQIAHNVVVGENSAIAAQSGISGSTELGAGVVLAGQAGLVGHIQIGDGAVIAAQAGVTKSIPANTTVSGYPAREHAYARRLYAYTARLPDLYKRIRKLEEKLARLERENTLDKTAEDDK
jgi:UDP-3-O-[3-hydroxymyristoyl] glucosamine N-acyltransferase